MSVLNADREWVASYAREGSEAAFQSLVDRHVNLVYATAFRQTGDRQLAEEVTQNTFVALARKARGVAGHEAIAGWLHRTAILEAKARMRAEFRRQRREREAADLTRLNGAGVSALEGPAALLDDGLLSLQESDRLALIQRYFEDRSFGEVGMELGVSEEAARKRVDRALSRLGDYFREHGFSVAGGSAAVLLSQAAQAAPAGLASQVGVSAFSAGAGGALVGLWFAQTIAWVKSPLILANVALATFSAAWFWGVSAEAGREQARLATQIRNERSLLAGLEVELSDLRRKAAEADGRRVGARTQTASTPSGVANEGRKSHWDESSSVVRVPKNLLKSLDIFGVRNHWGRLSEPLIEALQLNATEVRELEGALGRFVEGIHALEARVSKRVEPRDQDLHGRRPEEVRVFEVGDTAEGLGKLRSTLFSELARTLSGERLELFKRSLGDWMPIDDRNQFLNSAAGVFSFSRRLRFYRGFEQPGIEGEAVLGWSVAAEGRGEIFSSMRVDDIPMFLRGELQEWMDEAVRKNKEAMGDRGEERP